MWRGTLKRLSAVALVCLLSPAAAQAARWSIQAAPGQGGLLGVSCTSSAACTAVGTRSFFSQVPPGSLVERWNGHHWSLQHAPTPAGKSGSLLAGVSCPSTTTCIAVGESFIGPNGETTLTLAERWNGSRWTIQHTPPAPAGFRDGSLNGVSCTSARACTAVANFLTGPGNPRAVAERWDGTRWSIQQLPLPHDPAGAPSLFLTGVSCASSTMCVAVGSSFLPGSGTDIAVAEMWNGNRWTVHRTPVPAGTFGPSLSGVSCTSTTFCWAAGGVTKPSSSPFTPSTAQPLATRWNGTRWLVAHPPKPAVNRGSTFKSVSCKSSAACAAVGDSPSGATATAERWNGHRWFIQRTPALPGSSNGFFGVSCSAAAICTAVGTTNDKPLIERYS